MNGKMSHVVVAGLFLVTTAVVSVFGTWLLGDIADVQESVAVVHDLANSRLTELQQDLAAANERIAELSERIGGMDEGRTQ